MALLSFSFLALLLMSAADARSLKQTDGGQWNVTVLPEHSDRRMALAMGQSTPVSVTFYNSPGMDCTTGQGMCGYGNDVGGQATDGHGNSFVQTALYPLHAASGNFGFLGGCGACGTLSGNGLSFDLVITDVTNPLDSLERNPTFNPPQGSHIDICLPQFQQFVPGTTGNSGGIFTGTWTRKDCSTLGSPNYPSHDLVVRYEAYNPVAKAVVISRAPGAGVITGVTFVTAADSNGGNSGDGSPVFHPGTKVDGWGAWWIPNTDLAGKGGVRLNIQMEDGSSLTQAGYPMPDFELWNSGDLISLQWNWA